jgi:hypothetical protein
MENSENFNRILILQLFSLYSSAVKYKQSKAFRVRGRGGLYIFDTSRISHFLGNMHTDGSEVVNFTRRSRFTPHEDSWY